MERIFCRGPLNSGRKPVAQPNTYIYPAVKNEKILIVEDEQPIREMIAFHLQRAGFDTLEAEDCRQARQLLADERPVLALVDWMLPDMSGLELTRLLKRDKQYEDIAIILLTARAEEQDKVLGLDGGADDYITKPFSPRELIARIKAVLRRSATASDGTTAAGDIVLDAAAHRVTVNGDVVHLGPTEYRLLQYLMTHADRVYSRSQLLDRVWGANVYVEERTVDVHVRRLRKALITHGVERHIQTVRGAGYRFSMRDE
jgi:two-component system phosphate regulon response regulator PhoB